MLKPDWCPLEEQTQDNPENKVKNFKSFSAEVPQQELHKISVRERAVVLIFILSGSQGGFNGITRPKVVLCDDISRLKTSVADPGCLFQIPDPDFYPSLLKTVTLDQTWMVHTFVT
jgi:hypothetical protein